jgi:hypothetical protein
VQSFQPTRSCQEEIMTIQDGSSCALRDFVGIDLKTDEEAENWASSSRRVEGAEAA